MMNYHLPANLKIKHDKARGLYNYINKTYSTLAFCRKWLEQDGQTNHALALKYLVDQNVINPCPPLVDSPNSYVAQFEHTFLLKPTSKEILSRGDDY
jgi:methionyl aminopeptidase